MWATSTGLSIAWPWRWKRRAQQCAPPQASISTRNGGRVSSDRMPPITSATPKVLTTEAVQASDVVITMGCGDACPFFPGKRYEDWELTDPAGRGIEDVRPIRDDVKHRVQTLLAELLPTEATA